MKELFEKYIKRECSLEEVKQIVAYFKNSKNLSDVPTIQDVSKLLESFPDMEETAANRIHDTILATAKKQKSITLKKKKIIWRYTAVAAAAVIGVFVSGYLFNLKHHTPTVDAKPTLNISHSNTINSGTDKAVLTLGDGSVVSLGKDNSYQTKNANSNGEEIIYKGVKQNSSTIVYNYLTVPRGGQFHVTLSDGTEVWLNSESQLKYPVSFIERAAREVELVYGEAYFDVSPSTKHDGSKFKVFNKIQEIEVVGTEFNVKAYKDEPNILTTLVEGKIVVGNGILKQNLIPNQQSNLNTDSNNITVSKVDVYNEISWKEGVFSFEKKPFKDVMNVLSRWFDMEVVFENKEIEDILFDGVLRKEQNINDILTTIKDLGIISDYKISNKKVVLE